MRRVFTYLMAVGLSVACQAKETQTAQNSNNMNDSELKTEKAIFASGCFWGTEYYLQKADGVIATTAGYIGGHTKSPTYKEVCTKQTGHYEAVEVEYDPAKVSFEELAILFFETHDPEQKNGQGPDIGPQYRSAIFYLSEDQKATSQKLIDKLEDKGYDIATALIEAPTFWPAELYHQDYYDIKGSTPYCHSYKKKF